jgi:hypothetical protein
MTPPMALGIRRWETSANVVSVASARPAKAFCFFVFYVIYFRDLVLSVHTSSGSLLLFPSTTRDYVECRQFFACPTIVCVPTVASRGPSPDYPHSTSGSRP